MGKIKLQNEEFPNSYTSHDIESRKLQRGWRYILDWGTQVVDEKFSKPKCSYNKNTGEVEQII